MKHENSVSTRLKYNSELEGSSFLFPLIDTTPVNRDIGIISNVF